MEIHPIRFDEIRVGDHLLREFFSWQRGASATTTRLFVGGERVACHGFHVVEVVEVTRVGDDIIVNDGDEGEVTASLGVQTLKVHL